MITKDGAAKLADMGLARQATDVDEAKAEAGRAYGTPYYISPEQIRGEMDIDFRADIYSLGATLYHMITGRVPFDGETPVAVMQKHLHQELTPPDHLNESLSAGISEVVEVMMAKDRNRRYASTRDLLTDLDALAGGDPPLLARQHIDESVLGGLSQESAGGEGTGASARASSGSSRERSLVAAVVGLSAALGVAILVIIVLIIIAAS
jgi:serine/threonine-protein kinase